ncbi:MAG: transcriptional coactivator p15/PC4 family protein [Proteobacteria bacterium]|nr:transcriptional coactivator p15/PC4 family protein [Pseudomonadota bacterium]
MQIGEIDKGKDKIIVTVKEFKGKQYIDIRTFFENDDGEWIPTKKGISFTPENLDEAIKLLQKARKNVAGKEE